MESGLPLRAPVILWNSQAGYVLRMAVFGVVCPPVGGLPPGACEKSIARVCSQSSITYLRFDGFILTKNRMERTALPEWIPESALPHVRHYESVERIHLLPASLTREAVRTVLQCMPSGWELSFFKFRSGSTFVDEAGLYCFVTKRGDGLYVSQGNHGRHSGPDKLDLESLLGWIFENLHQAEAFVVLEKRLDCGNE